MVGALDSWLDLRQAGDKLPLTKIRYYFKLKSEHLYREGVLAFGNVLHPSQHEC